MKIILLSFVCLLVTSAPIHAQTKRALIIAIGDYPLQSGWETINSGNDVMLIREALRFQKFPMEQITVLQDEKAHKPEIVKAIETLIGQSRPGDKVVIHFSSHGQQITDDNDDELDGYDEAIVCYGAPAKQTIQPGYTGDQHLRDDELNQLMDQLRAKLGTDGDILVIADACHSGTINRGGLGKIRGKALPLDTGQPNIRPLQPVGKSKPFLAESPLVTATGLAPYVIISAAKASEANTEHTLPDGKGVGSLSYAINKTLRSVRSGETYRLLFNRIVSEMKQIVPNQTPEITGTYDRELFGGKAVRQEPYYSISEAQNGGRQILIPAGKLESVYPGTQVHICPAGTINPATATAFTSGTVTEAGLFSASIQLDQPIRASQQANLWVFITERSYGDLSIAICLDSLTASPARTAVGNALSQLPLAKISSLAASELYLIQSRLGAVTIRRATDGFSIGDPISVQSDGIGTAVSNRIQNYAQGKFLQAFTPTFPGIDLRMELIPNAPASQDASDTINRAPFQQNGLMAFSTADKASVRVTNRGTLRVYFSIIDIQPDGIVTVVFPTPVSTAERDLPENYVLAPGMSMLIPRRVSFSPPYGTETFKVLAAQEKFDLRNAIGLRTKGRGEGTRGLSTTLEKVFGRAQVMMRGGAAEESIPETAIGTFSYPFLIVHK